MKNSFYSILVLFILLGTKQTLIAQQSEPNAIQPVKIDGEIHFDGILNDSIWKSTRRISNFTQRGNPQ